eukprot:134301-Chlamydomonas_euryale.AAC.1
MDECGKEACGASPSQPWMCVGKRGAASAVHPGPTQGCRRSIHCLGVHTHGRRSRPHTRVSVAAGFGLSFPHSFASANTLLR